MNWRLTILRIIKRLRKESVQPCGYETTTAVPKHGDSKEVLALKLEKTIKDLYE